jgi:hydroxymethylbilane synthase
MDKRCLKVGTRGSRLALTQCYQAIADIQDISKTKYKESLDSSFNIIVTTGDAMQGTAGAQSLTKTAWVDKIEEALLNKTINLAIHSGKDIPKDIAKGTKLIPVGKRNIPFDVFVGKMKNGQRIKFSQLSSDANVGTASLRRELFLKEANLDFTIVPHRGNVPTRIKKLDASDTLDGIILAAAGIRRLNLGSDYDVLNQDILVPSALQGTLVAQIREDDSETQEIIRRVLDLDTETCFRIERSLSEALGADCKSCVGVYASIKIKK